MLYFLVQNEEGKPEASLLKSEVFPCVEFRIFRGALLRDYAQTFSVYSSVEEKLQHPTKLQTVALLICLCNRGHITGMGRELSLGPSIQIHPPDTADAADVWMQKTLRSVWFWAPSLRPFPTSSEPALPCPAWVLQGPCILIKAF